MQLVVAGAAEENVLPDFARDEIVATQAVDDVESGGADQFVVVFRAEDGPRKRAAVNVVDADDAGARAEDIDRPPLGGPG